MKPVAYGIDFGTSNSLICAAGAEGVEVVGDRPSVPSIAYFHREGFEHAGDFAVDEYLLTASDWTSCHACDLVTYVKNEPVTRCRAHSVTGGCLDSRLMVGVKSDFSDRSFTSTHSWARDMTLPDIASVIIGDLKAHADTAYRADVRRVVLGHPVLFVGAEGPGHRERQQIAVERLVEAASLAGFDEIELLPEPHAALMAEENPDGTVVALDFGGGTFDVAVIDYDGGRGEVRSMVGAPIGGDMFDARLFEHAVEPILELSGLSGEYRRALRTLGGVMFLMRDHHFHGALATLRQRQDRPGLAMLHTILTSGFAYAFYRAVESVKIELSTSETCHFRFRRGSEVDVEFSLERGTFESLIERDLDTIESVIWEALKDAGVQPDQVGLIARTGGSSSIPAFVRRIDRIFGPDRSVVRGPFTAVAQGLGLRALELWGS